MSNVNRNESFYICSWNVWGLLLAPRALSNPSRCSEYLSSIIEKDKLREFDGLLICGIQELWSWNTGFIPSTLLSSLASAFEYIPYFGHAISIILQLITIIIGAIPIFRLFSFKYCPKQFFANRLIAKHVGFNYCFYDNSIPSRKYLDNGLLLLCIIKPDLRGSHAYTNAAREDSFAHKGFIYLYFVSRHCLVINTHLQAAGDDMVKIKQLGEMREFIKKFDSQHKIKNRKLRVIILGDFNINTNNHDKMNDILTVVGNEFSKINSCEPTYYDETEGAIDQIVTNFEVKNVKERILGKLPNLSDHYLIVNEFHT